MRIGLREADYREPQGSDDSYYRFLGSAPRAAEGWEAEDDPFVSPTILFDQLEFAVKDAEKAVDRYAPIQLGGPLSTIFAWLERQEARKCT